MTEAGLTNEQVLTRFGPMTVVANDRPVGEALRLYGEWAFAEIDFVVQFIPDDAVIVDAGSNIGSHARAFAHLRPGSKIHAIEPQPQIADILRLNTASLGDRIIVHDFALGVSGASGFMPRLAGALPRNVGALSVTSGGGSESVPIAIRSLDSLQLPRLDFLKLDIEGAEARALQGARQTIARLAPVVFSEVNSVEAAIDVFREAKHHVYEAFFIVAQAFNPANVQGNTHNIFGPATETALLFVPVGRPRPKGTDLCRAIPVRSVDEIAAAFLAAPRYGDASPIVRDPRALAEELKRATRAAEAAETQAAQLQREIEAERRESLRKEGVIALAQEAAAAAEVSRRASDRLVASLNERVDRLTDSVSTLTSDRDSSQEALEREREINRRTVARMKEEGARLESSINALVEERDKEAALARDVQAQVESSRKTLEQERDVHRRTVARMKEEAARLESSINTLVEERDNEAALAREVQAQVRTLEGRMSEIRGELREEGEKRIRLAQVLDDERTRSQEAIVSSEKERKSADLRATAAKVVATDVEAALARKDEWSQRLRDGLHQLRAEHSQQSEELARARQTLRLKEAELLEVRARHDALMRYMEPKGLVELQRGFVGRFARRGGALAQAIAEIETSGYFDAAWYLKTYPDVEKSEFEAAIHYLLFGGYEGRDPSERFNTADYMSMYPDVKASGLNPLLHYLRWGRRELRKTRQTKRIAPTAEAVLPAERHFEQKAPPLSFFEKLPRPNRTNPEIDVVVPVHRGYDETLACLASVLTSKNASAYDLIVVDDCSPEPELSEALDQFAALGLITLHRNGQNLGFVRTVNRAMQLNEGRDVILLNSDTIVSGDWIDRLRNHARANERVATVTPFTNNGTICSFPNFCADNALPAHANIAGIDQCARALMLGKSIPVPTGVGFCMLITREALRDVGLFDEPTFGKGYGEENDFCLRASNRGWSNLHALDTFVFHSGEASFGETASQRKIDGVKALLRKHPEYQAQIDEFIDDDPASPARLALNVATTIGQAPGHVAICVTHTLGGGIEKHLRDRAQHGAPKGEHLLLLTPATAGTCEASLSVSGVNVASGLRLDVRQHAQRFVEAMKLLGVSSLEVHSTVGWSHRVVDLIPRIARELGVELKVMLHDYTFACPQTTLINESGVYCGEEGEQQCRRCLSKMTTQPGIVHPDLVGRLPDITQWRGAYGTLLGAANSVAAPSHDTAKRYKRYFPRIEIAVEPHVEDIRVAMSPAKQIAGEPVRVAVIGAIGPHKGSRVLLDCARDAATRRLPLEFIVVGFSDIDDQLRAANVSITGKYDEQNLPSLLATHRPHMSFLPSAWPETYCYALSAALAAGLPVCAFNLGAQADRLAGRDALLLDVGLMNKARAINDQLLRFASSARQDAIGNASAQAFQ